jgi:hypothetical protein
MSSPTSSDWSGKGGGVAKASNTPLPPTPPHPIAPTSISSTGRKFLPFGAQSPSPSHAAACTQYTSQWQRRRRLLVRLPMSLSLPKEFQGGGEETAQLLLDPTPIFTSSNPDSVCCCLIRESCMAGQQRLSSPTTAPPAQHFSIFTLFSPSAALSSPAASWQ